MNNSEQFMVIYTTAIQSSQTENPQRLRLKNRTQFIMKYFTFPIQSSKRKMLKITLQFTLNWPIKQFPLLMCCAWVLGNFKRSCYRNPVRGHYLHIDRLFNVNSSFYYSSASARWPTAIFRSAVWCPYESLPCEGCRNNKNIKLTGE